MMRTSGNESTKSKATDDKAATEREAVEAAALEDAREYPATDLGQPIDFKPKLPLRLTKIEFLTNSYAYYDWLLKNAPLQKAKASVMNCYAVSPYEDCKTILTDRERVTRVYGKRKGNVKDAKGGYPVPKAIRHLMSSMISSDEPEHKRLRNLVQKAFTPKAVSALEPGIHTLADKLLNDLASRAKEGDGTFDLISDYCLPIPVNVIGKMMGTTEDEMPEFIDLTNKVVSGLSGFGIIRSMFSTMPKMDKFIRKLIVRKRKAPEDDILSRLIHAEEDGDRLTDDELVAMGVVLTTAGFETTVYLIANVVLMLLMHPRQKAFALSSEAWLKASIEETLRFHGSVSGTEINYAMTDLELSGGVIPRGSAVFPLLAAGNRDPNVFENPDVFNIARTPNRHLGFGHGIHFCIGAALARMETRVAVQKLFERFPNIELAVPPKDLEVGMAILMRRYKSMPVRVMPS